MEQKSKNHLRMILVLLLFGMSLLAMGLGLATRGFNFYGVVGVVMVPAGVSLIVLGVHYLRKDW